MSICLSHTSALEYLRSVSSAPFELASSPRTGKLDDCGSSKIADILEQQPVCFLSRPLHIMLPDASREHRNAGFVRHTCSIPLPRRALVKVSDDVFISSPELCFVQLATVLSEIELILVGYELCGTYAFNGDEIRGFGRRKAPLTHREKILSFIDAVGSIKGAKKAKKAANILQDGSASPMETAMALLISGPMRIGGAGIKRATLNNQISTPTGTRKVDLFWPRYQFGLEYQGRAYHGGEDAHERDERRKNEILASGIELMNVYYRDLANPLLFDRLIRNISRATGHRVRVRMQDFRYRQTLLRTSVLPSIQMP